MADIAKLTADVEAGKGCPELKAALDGITDPDDRLSLLSQIADLNKEHRIDHPALPDLEVGYGHPGYYAKNSAGLELTSLNPD